jgi:aspartyl-tRNA(Asn)/glutamyl-tRNA(Gln) amidotransferase subunit C
MLLKEEEIQKICSLSRLSLSSTEIEKMRQVLSIFFDTVQTMQAVDTHGVTPMAHPLDATANNMQQAHKISAISLRLRPDVVTEADNRQANQASAPAVQEGYFLVPKVIE